MRIGLPRLHLSTREIAAALGRGAWILGIAGVALLAACVAGPLEGRPDVFGAGLFLLLHAGVFTFGARRHRALAAREER